MKILPKMIVDEQIRALAAMAHNAHHDEGHGSGHHLIAPSPFRADKPFHLPWLAEIISRHAGLTVDEWMQIYRLPVGAGTVPPHVDEDFNSPNGRATHSVLLYLNKDYGGGETVFNRSEVAPHVEPGAGLIFPHALLHEGRPVTSGEKLILKTDAFT